MLLRHSEDHAPDATAEAGGEVRHRNASAVRITGVRAGHDVQHHRAVAHGAGHGSRRVHRPAQGDNTVTADPAVGGLQSDDPTEA